MTPRVGVLLMAHGTPSSLDDMPEYLTLVRGGRPPSDELVHEMRTAPSELRMFVAAESRRFLAYNGAEHVILNAIPRACRFPAIVRRVVERLQSIAALD